MKLLVTRDKNGVVTEHPGKSFREVCEQHKDQDVDIFLERWDNNGIGHVFKATKAIGNSNQPLTQEDYYKAYDSLF